jgi:hypothetical protein
MNDEGTFARWAAWAAAVLEKVDPTGACRAMLAERQADIDTDAEETQLVAAQFREELEKLGHDPDRACVFIPSRVAATWLKTATQEHRRTNMASAHLASLGIPELTKKKTGGVPGWRWLGKQADAASNMARLNVTKS